MNCFSRKKKEKFLKKGEDVYISKNTVIKHPDKSILGSHIAIDDWLYASCILDIGNYVHISSNVSIIGGRRCKLKVGHFVNIATGTRVICGSSDFLNDGIISSPVLPKHLSGMLNEKLDPVVIEDFVTIGAGCIIMNGVTLKKGSVIGAGSIVTKDTEPWTLYIGSPARPYKKLDKDNKLSEAYSIGYPFVF
jgi:acetyltransferase-like isoleucine patch superfamily enzyme